MDAGRLAGKRVLVTQAKDYMGPATIELFREHGAEVIADESDLTQPDKQLLTTVPIGRLATAREDALFALFLASDESDFFVGQSIPFSGGWAQ